MQTAARVTLLAFAAILAAYGVVFLVQPAVLGGLVGLELAGPDAAVEIRAFYGGLELGMAAFLVICARDPRLLAAGLLFCALAFSFAGGARLLGVAQYGTAGVAQPVVAVIELLGAAWSGWLRARVGTVERGERLRRAG